MAWHLYLMPLVVDARGRRHPKYWNGGGVLDYGMTPVCLSSQDVDAATDSSIAAQPDVDKIPDNLDASPNATALTQIRQALEDLNIPGAGMFDTATPWRRIVRHVCTVFMFMQRYPVVTGDALNIFDNLDLNREWQNIPQLWQDRLKACADDMQLDTTGIGPTTSLRAILVNASGQLADRSIVPAGIGL